MEANNKFNYIGSELSTFSKAIRWKQYWISKINAHVKGNILEVGAGTGSNLSLLLQNTSVTSITALEPDESNFQQLERLHLPCTTVVRGMVDDLSNSSFDTILYIDVLEHIKESTSEVVSAAKILRPGGTLVALCPAYGFLFSPFDKSVGHVCRYNRQTLTSLLSRCDLDVKHSFYLDSLGVVLSLLNKLILRQGTPSQGSIVLWDRVIIPISRHLDLLLGYRFGRSIVVVAEKPS